MTALESALVLLVLVWTAIFIILGLMAIYVFLAVRRAMNKLDKFIDTTEQKAEEFDVPSKIISGLILAFMTKNTFQTVKKFTEGFLGKKK